MTKLSNMDLPDKGHGMVYCEKCKEWVPEIKKHNRKRHQENDKKI